MYSGIISPTSSVLVIHSSRSTLIQRHCVSAGHLCCAAPTCADDMLVLSDTQEALQFLLSIAVDNSVMERYHLQPAKSVLLYIPNTSWRSTSVVEPHVTLKEVPMPVVSETSHMGILRLGDTQESVVRENAVSSFLVL